MAKYEDHLASGFEEAADWLHQYILRDSLSAKLEDETMWQYGNVLCLTRVYERYSWLGGNRLTLTLNLFGRDGDVRLSAITSGGSKAVFFKINILGEGAFLDSLIRGVEKFKRKYAR